VSDNLNPTEDDLAYVAEAIPDDVMAQTSLAEVRYVVASLIAGERRMYGKTLLKLAAEVEARLIAGSDDHRQAALARSVPAMLRAVAEKMQ
jgi:hypothetical protein